ncbi:hypothetical protein [Niveispirillum sp. KHB5.9]|uniref:hypothetical protein n=1 Tax=Niveispirillum sp. KHB5.9 TaxID=3400269 RepID=UPI003A8AF045
MALVLGNADKITAAAAIAGEIVAPGANTGMLLGAGTLAAGAVGKLAGVADEAASMAGNVGNFTRNLEAADLGVKGTLQELRGAFTMNEGAATIKVDMIRGEIRNPLNVVGNMMETAKANGANSLRIEGTIANERLYGVLEQRYGLTSSGSVDSIDIPIR